MLISRLSLARERLVKALSLSLLSLSTMVSACRHAGQNVVQTAGSQATACTVRNLDQSCSTAEQMLEFNRSLNLDAATPGFGLTEADKNNGPWSTDKVNRVVAAWLAKLKLGSPGAGSGDLQQAGPSSQSGQAEVKEVAGTDPRTQRTFRVELADCHSEMTANPVFTGIMTTDDQGRQVQTSVFFKPEYSDVVAALGRFNNGYLDYQVTNVLRGMNLPGLIYPPVHYLPFRSGGYGQFDAAPIASALVVQNAAADDRILVPLLDLLKKGGGLNETLRFGWGIQATDIAVPEPVQAKLLTALQSDAILRFMFDDCDGHARQYLLSLKMEQNRLIDADLVSLDRGASGSSLGFFISGRPVSESHLHRMNLMSASAIDLSADFSVPLPSTLDGATLRAVAALAAAPLPEFKLDPSGQSSDYDARYREKVAENISLVQTKFHLTPVFPGIGAVDLLKPRAEMPSSGEESKASTGDGSTTPPRPINRPGTR